MTAAAFSLRERAYGVLELNSPRAQDVYATIEKKVSVLKSILRG